MHGLGPRKHLVVAYLQHGWGGTLTATTCSRPGGDTGRYFSKGDGGGGACNDDACGLQSQISGAVTAGPGLHTLTIDGWGGNSGSYSIAVTRP